MELVKPELKKLSRDPGKVRPDKPFTVQVTIRNPSEVMDAFTATVLGIDTNRVRADPPLLPLFPETEGTMELEITLPGDHAAGHSELVVRVDSSTVPAATEIGRLPIDVETTRAGAVEIDPESREGRRSGRFGVTVANTGNTPLDLMFVGDDSENHFRFRFVPPRLRLEAGRTESIQAIARGGRPFTGSAVPRAFTVAAEASGFRQEATASFTQRPWVPRLALVLAGLFAFLGLWAVVVGAAIDAVIDDSDNDLAASFEDGIGAVVEGLDSGAEQAAALEAARTGNLAARSVGADGTAGDGIALGDDGTGDAGATDAGGGDAGGGDAAGDPGGGEAGGGEAGGGEAGGGEADEPEAPEPDAGQPRGSGIITKALNAPADSLIGSVVAAAEPDRPIAGASVSVQAMLETPGLEGRVDPNREPIVLVAGEDGSFELGDMVPGSYAVTFSAPGYIDLVCYDVTVPAGEPRLATCRSYGFAVEPGPASQVGLIGEQASVAGIVTMAGDPFPGVTVQVSRLDTTTGVPVLQQRLEQTPATGPNTGRFSFVFEPSATSPLAPGTFEIEVENEGYISERLVVQLEGGQHVVGLEVAIAPVPTTTSSTTTTTTLPPEVRKLFGTVTDAATGAPIANASVQVAGAGRSFELATLGNGTFEMQGLAVGLYNLSFSAPGYTPVAREIAVPQTDRALGSVALTRVVASITGTVTAQAPRDTDPNAPLQLAAAPLAGADIRDANGRLIAQTDPNGVWVTTESFAPGQATFTVSADGYLPAAVTATVAPPAQATATTAQLVVRDSWVATVGTPISTSLLVPELECVGGTPAPTFAPHTTALAVTGVRWLPPSGTAPASPAVTAALQTTAGGTTQLVLGNVPRQGALELDLGGGPAGLYVSTITITDLTTPGAGLTLDFIGPGGLSAVVPVTDFGPALRCPTLSTGPNPGDMITPIGRSFYLRDAVTDQLVYLIDQLQLGVTVTATFDGGISRTGTPTAPAPFATLQ